MNRLKRKAIQRLALAVSLAMGLLAQPNSATEHKTVINGRPLTQRQRIEFQLIYGVPPANGNFWYDARSGMWGYWGHETAGLLQPSHNFGALAADASNGDTGVFVNGRQLNALEVLRLQQLLGAPIQPGRVWLDGTTGNFGREGSLMPLGNVASLIKSKEPRKPLYSLNELMGGSSNSAGTCTKAGNCYYSGR